jgi:phage-related protein
MTKQIALTRGMVTLVSDCDYEELNKHKWSAQKGGKTFYAVRRNFLSNVSMHRVILNIPYGAQVDHKDGNGLNNTRSNLRIATRSQNQANRKISSNNTSGFKGIYWNAGFRKWRAIVICNKKTFYAGYYDTAEEAARAYDKKARELFGEYAKTNY